MILTNISKKLIFRFLLISIASMSDGLLNLWAQRPVPVQVSKPIPQIRGILLKHSGKPLPYTELELVPTHTDDIVYDNRLVAVSGSNGRFTFADVPSGRYTLSINYEDIPTELSPYETFFYPAAIDRGDAEIFEINKNTFIENLNFRLPAALIKRDVKGRVLWEDETPVKDAMICFTDILASAKTRRTSCGGTRTDRNGRFQVIGFENREYHLGALVFDGMPRLPTDPHPTVVAAGEIKVFRLNGTISNFDVHVRKSKVVIQDIFDKFMALHPAKQMSGMF